MRLPLALTLAAGLAGCAPEKPAPADSTTQPTGGTGPTGSTPADTGCDTPATWFQDADGDGYGDPGSSETSCQGSAGFTSVTGDCDDGDATVFPGAAEDCDGRDDDCDGEADEDLAVSRWYDDADGDGYGTGAGVDACEAPQGAVAIDGDCDDDDPDTHPGGVDACFSGVDEDCDGLAPDCALAGSYRLDDVWATWTPADYSEKVGRGGASVRDLDADGIDDLLISEPDAYRGGGHYWTAYVVRDVARGDALLDDVADAELLGTFDATGAVAAVGDMDGDGVPELAIGTGDIGDGSSGNGVFVAPGDTTGTYDLAADAWILTPPDSGDYPGYALADAGDLDGDGLSELAVSAHGSDLAADFGGAVYLVFGRQGPISDLADAAAVLTGPYERGGAGMTMQAGADFDGDGVPDVVAGGDEDGTPGVWVAYGPFEGEASLADLGVRLSAERDVDDARYLGPAGDLDGDGRPDLVIGAPFGGSDDEGRVYAYLSLPVADDSLTRATVILEGGGSMVGAGQAVDGSGDLDGDGVDDLLVSGEGGSTQRGVVYATFGPLHAGTVDLSMADASFVGVADDDEAGGHFAAGDFDGDGKDDLAIAARGTQSDPGVWGAWYVFGTSGL